MYGPWRPGPVVVDQVGVRGVVLQGLEGVAHPARHEDRRLRAELGGEARGRTPAPARRSTQAPKIRPVATETNLSHGSAWMPRVAPAVALNEMLFCTGREVGQAERRPSSPAASSP